MQHPTLSGMNTTFIDPRKHQSQKSSWDYAASAMMAGVVTKSTCAPLERIRLLYQVQGMFQRSSIENVKYQSLIHTAKTIFNEEGLVGFWRGNGTNMIRAAVVYAVKFGTNDTIKERMMKKKKKKLEALSKDESTRLVFQRNNCGVWQETVLLFLKMMIFQVLSHSIVTHSDRPK